MAGFFIPQFVAKLQISAKPQQLMNKYDLSQFHTL